MCSPVSNGEMSPCPRLRFFHQKRKWKHTLLAWGREGLGRLLEEVREDGEREREKERTRGCSHLDLLYGHFQWTKSEVGGHFGFIGKRRAGRFEKETLTVSYQTAQEQVCISRDVHLSTLTTSMTCFYLYM